MLEEQINDTMASVVLVDMIRSVLGIQNSDTKLINLSEVMKQGLIEGAMNLRNIISSIAFTYYAEHEFEPTPEVIPLMRTVVEGYAASGGRLS